MKFIMIALGHVQTTI